MTTERLTDGQKEVVVASIRDWMQKHYKLGPLYRACLHWAYATMGHLNMIGYRAILQAGSASFERLKPEDDDGVVATHFGYEFNYTLREALDILRDDSRLLEFHCWVGLPETGEIIDLTTMYQPQQCEIMHGLKWTKEPPPPFVWDHGQLLAGRGMFYDAKRDAIDAALVALVGSLDKSVDEAPFHIAIPQDLASRIARAYKEITTNVT